MNLKTINIEPSWNDIANIALSLLGDPTTAATNAKGREIVRDMGRKLSELRAQQSDCPDHLKQLRGLPTGGNG